jgi:hypothetical protein
MIELRGEILLPPHDRAVNFDQLILTIAQLENSLAFRLHTEHNPNQ